MLDPTSKDEWFVSDRGNLSGPHRVTRFAYLVRWGKVSAYAYVCDTESSAWIPIQHSAFAPLLDEARAAGGGSLERTRASTPTAVSPGTRLLALALALGAFAALAFRG
jgi:hypothetical protein